MYSTRSLGTILAGLALTAPSAFAQWSTTDAPARRGAAATSVGDLALFAGGTDPDIYGSPWWLDVVSIYDASDGTWSTATLSVARDGIGAASVAGRAYFGGGRTSATNGDSSVLDVFDTATGAWSATQLPTVAGETVAVGVGTTVLFSDGSAVDLLDTTTGTFTSTTLSQPRAGIAAVSVGGVAMFAGGETSSGYSAVVDVYDPVTQSWSVAQLSDARRDALVAVAGGKALFASGIGSTLASGSVVDVYDPATAAWTVEQMPTGGSPVAATGVGLRAIFLDWCGAWGGCGARIFDVETGLWSSSTQPGGYLGMTAVSVGSAALFAFGGWYSSSCTCHGTSSTVHVYDSAVGVPYCSPATPNSTGASAELSVLGWPGSASQGALQLAARDLPPGASGYFLASRTQGSVAGPGGSQGTLCLGGAIGRFVGPGQVLAAGADGRFALPADLTALPQPTGAVAAQAGETWSFQAWYRDANPGPTSNFTDAVGVTLQ